VLPTGAVTFENGTTFLKEGGFDRLQQHFDIEKTTLTSDGKEYSIYLNGSVYGPEGHFMMKGGRTALEKWLRANTPTTFTFHDHDYLVYPNNTVIDSETKEVVAIHGEEELEDMIEKGQLLVELSPIEITEDDAILKRAKPLQFDEEEWSRMALLAFSAIVGLFVLVVLRKRKQLEVKPENDLSERLLTTEMRV